MMRVPAAPTRYKYAISNFKGANLTDAPANVKPSFSPSCPNMLRESVGKVRKWAGYHTITTYGWRINGVHFLDIGEKKRVIHAGSRLLYDGNLIYGGLNDERSMSKQMNGMLWIFDGKQALVFGEFNNEYIVKSVEEIAKTPTVLIAKKPTGGGTPKEPVNLLCKNRTEGFLGTEADKVYQLAANNLDEAKLKVKKLKSNGEWEEIAEGSAFSVNRKTGTITFSAAPGKSPAEGEDNIFITYSKTNTENLNKINKADICTLYGVNAAEDRIFVAGNPKDPNRDYYCDFNDATMWGDLWYSVIGQDNSRIMGYSIVNNQLAAHKNQSDDEKNIVLRTGVLNDGKAAFKIAGIFQGTGAVSKYAFSVLATEPVFLTESGIYAVTPSDVLGERYAQERSYYLKGAISNELNLSNAISCVYDGFYMLAINNRMYALDGTQIIKEQNAPYSTRQYVGYYRENVCARVLFTENGKLYFGTDTGQINEFYTDYARLSSFSDNGKPIQAYWETPELYGAVFYSKKTFRKISLLLGAAAATGARIWAIYGDEKELVRDYDSTARYFSYSQFSYSKLTSRTDRAPQNLTEKIKIKKTDKIKFIFENNILNEPFAIYSAISEYEEVN